MGAQEAQPIEVARLFTWLTTTSPDWRIGVLYTLLGAVGALVVVFSLIGGAVPGTAGFARIEAGLKRAEERERILDELLQASVRNAEEIRAVEIAANNLRDDVAADRRRQFAIAAALYTLLGGFFAAMLAQDILQALIVGAAWTSYLGALGLKGEYAERKSIKDDVTQRLEAMAQRAIDGLQLTDHERREAVELLSDANISKAL